MAHCKYLIDKITQFSHVVGVILHVLGGLSYGVNIYGPYQNVRVVSLQDSNNVLSKFVSIVGSVITDLTGWKMLVCK